MNAQVPLVVALAVAGESTQLHLEAPSAAYLVAGKALLLHARYINHHSCTPTIWLLCFAAARRH